MDQVNVKLIIVTGLLAACGNGTGAALFETGKSRVQCEERFHAPWSDLQLAGRLEQLCTSKEDDRDSQLVHNVTIILPSVPPLYKHAAMDPLAFSLYFCCDDQGREFAIDSANVTTWGEAVLDLKERRTRDEPDTLDKTRLRLDWDRLHRLPRVTRSPQDHILKTYFPSVDTNTTLQATVVFDPPVRAQLIGVVPLQGMSWHHLKLMKGYLFRNWDGRMLSVNQVPPMSVHRLVWRNKLPLVHVPEPAALLAAGRRAAASKRVSLLIAVHVTSDDQIRLVRSTWGRVVHDGSVRVEMIFFGFVADGNSSLLAEAHVRLSSELTNGARTLEMLLFAHARMTSGGVDWLYKLDWHCVVDVRMLLNRLLDFDVTERVYMGLTVRGNQQNIATGGAGYILSRASVGVVAGRVDLHHLMTSSRSEDQGLWRLMMAADVRVRVLHGLFQSHPLAETIAAPVQGPKHGVQDHDAIDLTLGLPPITYHYSTASDLVSQSWSSNVPKQFVWPLKAQALVMPCLTTTYPFWHSTADNIFVSLYKRMVSDGRLHKRLVFKSPSQLAHASAVESQYLSLFYGGASVPSELACVPELWDVAANKLANSKADCFVIAIDDMASVDDEGTDGEAGRMRGCKRVGVDRRRESNTSFTVRSDAFGMVCRAKTRTMWAVMRLLVYTRYYDAAEWLGGGEYAFLASVRRLSPYASISFFRCWL